MPEQVAKAGQSAGQKFAQADAEYAGRLESLSMGERALLGLPYIANDADMTKRRMVARQLTYDFNHTRPGPSTPDDPISDLTNSERRAILATLFGLSDDSAKRIFIDPPFHCDFGTNIKFEGDFYANFNCTILDCAQVRIGHGVLFAPNVHIYAATHSVSVTEREQGFERALPVSIGSDTWVGGNVSIMAGVSIGKGCTIGAGSVVTRDIPNYSVAVGNPARVVKVLAEEERGGRVAKSGVIAF